MPAPLDTLESVVNTARVRLNDAIEDLTGDILKDDSPFTLVYINAAWRRFQERLVELGFAWLKLQLILTIPATTNNDPGSEVYLNWDGFYDGTHIYPNPALSQNFIAPLILWERPSSGQGSYFPMDKLENGLPGVPKRALNKSWEWKNGAIYMPGATVDTDLRIRFAAFYDDFLAPADLPFDEQTVPIVRALNPLAWLICSEVAKARGDVDAGQFDQQGESSIRMLFGADRTAAAPAAKQTGDGQQQQPGARDQEGAQ